MTGRVLAWALVPLGAVLPFVLGSPYALQLASLVVIYGGLMVALNLCFGYGGLVSVAHGGMFGAGAYATGVLMTTHQWNFWATLPVAAVLGCAMGGLLGLLTLRMHGHYFVIASLAFGLMAQLVLSRWTAVTGGELGLGPIPTYSGLPGVSFESPTARYLLAFGFLVVFCGVSALVVRSPLGRRLAAIKQNGRLADALGIDPVRTRLAALLISSAMAALAGSVYAPYIGFLDPSAGGIDLNFKTGLALIIGGGGTALGPVIGAAVHVLLPEALRGAQEYSVLALGVVLLVVIRFAPHGVAGTLRRLLVERERPAPEPEAEEEKVSTNA
ncbi:branched-chain amino acid ABC transporter permease [Actinomadura atramentaria]|uniref:branched-chain amino acid ABC transporter permease n=1 Tax=Actinomadura atramentaria TaxID=1990 RepID=UPI001F0B1414|nr:branched-chain amino acid ABC transporter permease [Actinomadura atramentaria]